MIDPLSAVLIIRRLNATNDTDVIDAANSTDNGGGNAGGSGTSSSMKDELMAYEKFGFVFLAFVILFLLCCTWRCCKRRRERRNLQLDSARADNVLGDMAMVPTDELDEDAELI